MEEKEAYTKLYRVYDGRTRDRSFWRKDNFREVFSDSINVDFHLDCESFRIESLFSFKGARKVFWKLWDLDICHKNEISIGTLSRLGAVMSSVAESWAISLKKNYNLNSRRLWNFEAFGPKYESQNDSDNDDTKNTKGRAILHESTARITAFIALAAKKVSELLPRHR